MVSEPNRVLDAMLALIAEPTSWTKVYIAGERRPDGSVIGLESEHDPHANCFCLVGARARAWQGIDADIRLRFEVNERILASIQTLFPDRHSPRGRYNLPTFNDHRDTTHADVLSVLRLARALVA